MTLSGLLADLYDRLDYASSPATEVTRRLTRFLNQAHRQILAHPSLPALRNGTLTFASVANQERYGLPPVLAQIEAITDQTTEVRLGLLTQDHLRDADPGLSSTGTPCWYVPLGQQAVAKQPSAAAEIFILSTSASDTGTAYLEGIRTGGYRVQRSVTMTGVTAVSFGAAYTDILEITKISLSAAAVGTVTILQTSGVGTELARIPIGGINTRYDGIALWPTPSSAITYTVDYVRTIPELVNTAEEPLLPEDYHWLLVEGALVSEWTKKADPRRADAYRAFSQGLRSLIYRVTCPPDYLPSRSARQGPEWSRLGGSYRHGAGVW